MALSVISRIRLIFMLHAISSGGLYSRLPEIQKSLGLDLPGLGLALSGFTLGSIMTFFVVSQLIEKFGTKPVLLGTVPLLPVGTALIAAMPSGAALFAFLVVYGVLYSLPNTAMNIEADRIENKLGRQVMNSCHGLWSAGYLGATMIGTLSVANGLSPFWHMVLLATLLLPFGYWVVLGLKPAPVRVHHSGKVRRIALPTVPILLLVLYSIGPNLLEGGLRNWSVIFMRTNFGAPDWVDTLTLPLFLVAQAVGRMNADGWVDRFGRVSTARVLNAIALLGGVLVVFSPQLIIALAGFLLIGVGVCTTYPLTTSAAAQRTDRPATQNVAALTMVNQLVQLAAPPLLGLLASQLGIRAIFAIALPMVVLSIWAARTLVVRPTP